MTFFKAYPMIPLSCRSNLAGRYLEVFAATKFKLSRHKSRIFSRQKTEFLPPKALEWGVRVALERAKNFLLEAGGFGLLLQQVRLFTRKSEGKKNMNTWLESVAVYVPG